MSGISNLAQKIRSYIEDRSSNGTTEFSSDQIEWARKKADWIDPLHQFDDKILGDISSYSLEELIDYDSDKLKALAFNS